MKYFIITVDTEGDNLWSWNDGDPITTENTLYIPRFQELCETFSFRPTYLTNYEMAMDKRWIMYGKEKQRQGLCEIGMHLHAWNTPPIVDLENRFGGNPYITEFEKEAIAAKVQTMVDELSTKFECDIVSNRSGRWATNDVYLKTLRDCGIKVDCSVTPGLDLSHIPGRSANCGNDYSDCNMGAYEIVDGLLEVPMTTMKSKRPMGGSIKQRVKILIKGESLWLRPIMNVEKLKYLSDMSLEKCDYVEFMIHSSELMPGGSPYFPDSEAVDMLYKRMNELFFYLKRLGISGTTLSEYNATWRKSHNVNH